MKHSHFLIFSILSVILSLAVVSSFGQSTDRDNPTPLSSSEISGVLDDHQRDGNKETFYSFTAGPGEVTITFDVKRRNRDSGAGVAFEVLPRNGSSTPLLCCEYVQSGDGGTGREVATLKLARRQVVILHITNASNGGGSFTARLSGATSFGGSTSGGGYGDVSDNDNDNSRGRGDRDSSNKIDVPATGMLHIRMKNGTSQDIDLSRVRNISVRP
ncbi:MAG: hypothetical protein ABI999_07905 [Acidobacteriota bacterium]